MFQIGDKIFYPMHGGGVIKNIEEKEVLGETQLYYIVNLLSRNMQVLVPINKTEQLGMRHIVDPDELDNVLTTFHQGETDTPANDRQRHKINMDKIKSGNIYEGVQVIRDLIRMNHKKKLGTAEKNLLANAQQILASEVALVKGIPQTQAIDLIDQVVNTH